MLLPAVSDFLITFERGWNSGTYICSRRSFSSGTMVRKCRPHFSHIFVWSVTGHGFMKSIERLIGTFWQFRNILDVYRNILAVCRKFPVSLRKISRQFTENPRTVHRKLMVFRTFLRSVLAWADRIKAIKDEGGHAYDSGNI